MRARDLKVYSAQIGGEISHYRNRYGLETDVVLHLEDGRYTLVECKLGSGEIEEGASHLVPLREPVLLMVITGGEYEYRRADGVMVIPLACMRYLYCVNYQAVNPP